MRLQLVPVAGPDAALDKLLAEPDALAVADLATVADYGARHGLAPDRLVFQGELARRCLVTFVQKGGWVHSLGELAGARGAPPPTLGLVGADATAAFAILRRLDEDLAGIELREGAAGQLAQQVARGTLDGLLIVAYPDLATEPLERLADNDRLMRVPVVTRRLAKAVAGGQSGYTLAALPSKGVALPWEARPEPTLCTPIGAVLRHDTPGPVRDALPGAANAVTAALHKPDLADRAGSAVRGAARDTIALVRGWLADR